MKGAKQYALMQASSAFIAKITKTREDLKKKYKFVTGILPESSPAPEIVSTFKSPKTEVVSDSPEYGKFVIYVANESNPIIPSTRQRRDVKVQGEPSSSRSFPAYAAFVSANFPLRKGFESAPVIITKREGIAGDNLALIDGWAYSIPKAQLEKSQHLFPAFNYDAWESDLSPHYRVSPFYLRGLYEAANSKNSNYVKIIDHRGREVIFPKYRIPDIADIFDDCGLIDIKILANDTLDVSEPQGTHVLLGNTHYGEKSTKVMLDLRHPPRK